MLDPQVDIQQPHYSCLLSFADSGGFGFSKPKYCPVFQAPGATPLAKGLRGQLAWNWALQTTGESAREELHHSLTHGLGLCV